MSNYQGEPRFEDQIDEDERLEPQSSKRWLIALSNAEKKLNPWQTRADRIDKLYANLDTWSSFVAGSGEYDHEFNLFWASMEVVKPSIYSRPPVPVVTPVFKDRSPIVRTASEMLERCAVRGFSIADIDQVMLGVRDDLAIVARGVIWCTYESGKEARPYGERVCIEHLDRKDFLHEPARKWADVGWVARRAWLTKKEARKRFGEKVDNASFGQHKDDRGEDVDATPKTGIWEVWSKVDNKVYWVAEGCDEILDEEDPFLKLKKFFPCPRPAYGTLERRSLVPVPDIVYIEDQLESINELTSRIHGLCEKLVVRGIIPAGSDVGDAIEAAYRELDADHMIIPVPAAAFSTQNKYVDWLPIDMIAQALISAVEARRELIGNVQELLGIADIMRGETEAQETLGAQKLKAQYGSVRIRDKIAELVRIGRDTLQILSEIQAEEFSFDTLLEMARMELPKRAEIKKQLDQAKKAAKDELTALADKAEELLQSPEAQENQQAAQKQFQQAQQAILAKYQPIIDKLGKAVTQEDVKELLDDQKTGFADFDIQTDSTIYPDEMAEKASRNEYMTTFAAASTALAPLVATGPAGAQLAGSLLKFQLGPYRAGREVDAAIDEWIESIQNNPAPQQGADESAQALAQSQMLLAQAELQKAQAQGQNYQAQAELKQQQLQLQASQSAIKADQDRQAFQLEIEKSRGTVEETAARIEKIWAEIQAMGIKASNDTRSQDREDFKASTDVQFRAQDQMRQDAQTAQSAENQAFDQQQRLRGEDRSDRQQYMNERQAEVGNASPSA